MATNSMSSNKLVWVGVALLVGLVVMAIINSSNEKPKTTSSENKPVAETKKAEDGDTVSETLQEVRAKYEKSEEVNANLNEKLSKLETQLNRLANRTTASGEQKPDPRVEDLQKFVGALGDQMSQLTKEVTQEKSNQIAGENGYEVTDEDLGIDSKSSSKKNLIGLPSPQALPGYVTIKPMTRTQLLTADPKLADTLFSQQFSGTKKLPSNSVKTGLPNSLGSLKAEISPPKTYYTIPARGTVFKAKAMTALIGTVPLGGKVQDPFPARFIVGDKNLATNGIHIPGLRGIIFEGIARGNWNLSCVSVSLTGATYTFADGRIQHMEIDTQGGNKKNKARSPFAENEGSQSIGYLSDPQGVPCVAGKRITDAHKQLITMGVMGAAKSYFDAKAAAETTSSENILGGSNTSVTGNKSAFIENETYANTVETAMDFYTRRMRDTFDVIYRDPGAEVSLLITQDLPIDYHEDARKVAYSQEGNRHAKTMD